MRQWWLVVFVSLILVACNSDSEHTLNDVLAEDFMPQSSDGTCEIIESMLECSGTITSLADLDKLDGLTELSFTQANLEQNDIDLLPTMTNIETITLTAPDSGDMLFTTLDVSLFPNLRQLTINNTSLTSVTGLDTLVLLETLDLSNSALETLSFSTTTAAFSQKTGAYIEDALSALVSLDVSNNQLTTIELDSLPALQKLNISGNSVEELIIASMPVLTELNISNNALGSYWFYLFDLPSLQRLNLSYNQILDASVLNDVFAFSYDLTYLDLSNNNIMDTVRVFQLPNLKFLNLSNNWVMSLVLEPETDIQVLNISDNPLLQVFSSLENDFKCLNMASTPFLNRFNVEGNNSVQVYRDGSTITEDGFLSRFPNATFVDLDGFNECQENL